MRLKIVLDKQSFPKEQNCLFDRDIGVCRLLTKFIIPCCMEEIFVCNLREVGTLTTMSHLTLLKPSPIFTINNWTLQRMSLAGIKYVQECRKVKNLVGTKAKS